MPLRLSYKIAVCTLLAFVLLHFCLIYGVFIEKDLIWRSDATAFYTGAQLATPQNSEKLYNLKQQKILQLNILNGKAFKDDLLPFNYPPHFALFLSLFKDLQFSEFYQFFMALQLLAVSLILILAFRQKAYTSKELVLIFCLLLAQESLIVTIFLGALSIIMAFALFLFYLAVKNNKPLLTFLSVLLLTFKPQFLAILLPLLPALQVRQSLAFFLALISAPVICCSFYPVAIWLDFASLLKDCSTAWNELGIYPDRMINLKGTLARVFGPDYRQPIEIIVKTLFLISVSITGIGSYIIRRKKLLKKLSFELLYSLSILIYMVFSVHVNQQDAFILCLPALLIYSQLKKNSIETQLFISLLLFATIATHLLRSISQDGILFFNLICSISLLIFTVKIISARLDSSSDL